MRNYTDEEQNALIAEAIKTPEGTNILLELIDEHFPSEYAETMIKIIKKTIELKQDKIDEALHNAILDNFNDSKRTKDEMEILFRGKLSKDEIESLNGGGKHTEGNK